MPKLLVEGFRPHKGETGRWIGVSETRPLKTGSTREVSGGKVLPVPNGGSALSGKPGALSIAKK